MAVNMFAVPASAHSSPFGASSVDMHPDWYGAEHMTGTTIMAVEYDGGVVFGADSRTTTGAYIVNRVTDKLTPVTDRIFCCRSGSAADTQAIADQVKYYLNLHSVELGEKPTVKTTANLFREICYSNRDSAIAGIICAGWDERERGQLYKQRNKQEGYSPINTLAVERYIAFQLEACVSGNHLALETCLELKPPVLAPDCTILLRRHLVFWLTTGSGSTYIYGHCDATYKRDMSKEDCYRFVANAVALAMFRDGSSGGVIRLAAISKDGVERKVILGNELPRFFEG